MPPCTASHEVCGENTAILSSTQRTATYIKMICFDLSISRSSQSAKYLYQILSSVFLYPFFPIALGEPFKRSEERGMVGDHQVDLLLHRLGQDRLGQVVGQQDFFHLTLSQCNGNVFAHQPPWSLRARSAIRHYPRTQQGRWGPSLPTRTPPGFPQVPIILHLGAFSSTSLSYCSSTSSSNRMSHCLPFSNPSPQWNAIA